MLASKLGRQNLADILKGTTACVKSAADTDVDQNEAIPRKVPKLLWQEESGDVLFYAILSLSQHDRETEHCWPPSTNLPIYRVA